MENKNSDTEHPRQLGYSSSRIILGDMESAGQAQQNIELQPSVVNNQASSVSHDDLFVGMTSKDIVHAKPKRLIGVYVFAALCFLQIPGFLFADSNQIVSIIGIIIVSIMGIGILTRQEIARKVVIALAVLSIMVMIFGFFSFQSGVNKLDSSKPMLTQEFAKIQDDPTVSAQNKQNAKNLQIALDTQWNDMHKNVLPRIYAITGAIILFQSVTVVYFMLPKVRDGFSKNT